MIVSKTNNYIFVHIPKNGGTTIETLLLHHLDAARDMHFSPRAKIPDNRALFGVPSETAIDKHITVPRLRTAIGEDAYDGFFSFAFSRNPYSRCYSAYVFLIAQAKQDIRMMERGIPLPAKQEKHREARAKALDKSVDDLCVDLPLTAKTYGFFRPQTAWLPKPDSVNFVGRLETLSQDLHHIYRHVGLPTEGLATIPRENVKAPTGSWRSMSVASAIAIREYYAEDFTRLGYDPDVTAPEAFAPSPTLAAPASAPPAPQPTSFS